MSLDLTPLIVELWLHGSARTDEPVEWDIETIEGKVSMTWWNQLDNDDPYTINALTESGIQTHEWVKVKIYPRYDSDTMTAWFTLEP